MFRLQILDGSASGVLAILLPQCMQLFLFYYFFKLTCACLDDSPRPGSVQARFCLELARRHQKIPERLHKRKESRCRMPERRRQTQPSDGLTSRLGTLTIDSLGLIRIGRVVVVLDGRKEL